MVPITNEGIRRMDDVNCSEARHALWPPERPRLAEAEVLEARRHVQGCAACESYFAQDRVLLEAFDRASQERAPQILRERVFDALARERARGLGLRPTRPTRQVSRRWILAAAASVAGLLAGGSVVFLRSVTESPNDGGLFAEDYLRRAVAQEKLVSSDAAEISRFLTRELGRPIMPLQLAGLHLASAEVCLIEGRRGAMIQYIENGRKISHYLIPQEGTPARDPALSSTFGTGGIGGPALITWATPEIEQALVGEAPQARLMELARNASL
jgi:anti-sigma factor RsiW